MKSLCGICFRRFGVFAVVAAFGLLGHVTEGYAYFQQGDSIEREELAVGDEACSEEYLQSLLSEREAIREQISQVISDKNDRSSKLEEVKGQLDKEENFLDRITLERIIRGLREEIDQLSNKLLALLDQITQIGEKINACSGKSGPL